MPKTPVRSKAKPKRKPATKTVTKSASCDYFSDTLVAPKKRGRPRALTVDAETLKQVLGLGKLYASMRDCAAFFGVASCTWQEFYRDPIVKATYEQGQGLGRIRLRRSSFQLAETNAAMNIFLSKHILGMDDVQHNVVEFKLDFTNLTDEELVVAQKLMARNAMEQSALPSLSNPVIDGTSGEVVQ